MGWVVDVRGFVGRESELHQLRELRPRPRMLTLVGPGGAGKSRLALELAARLADRFEDGWHVLDLDQELPSRSLWEALGDRLGLRPPQRADTLRHLALKHVLLVLDNCDLAIYEVAQLAATLLASCVGVSVLATSRQPLWIDGEVVWSVPPLRSPRPDATDLEEIGSSDAVRLFVDRLQEVEPGFVLDANNAADVVRICTHLDQWPQVLQTAAARAHVEGLQQLTGRLDARSILDMRDDTREVPRHRSLRASLDWGASALEGADQTLLARLSVFAGGWTLASAEAVCADTVIPRGWISRRLTRLTARSFVQVDATSDPPRYRMSDVVREYGRRRARASIDLSAVERRHAEYMVGLASCPPSVLDREAENFAAALEWSIDARNPGLALELASMGYAIWPRVGALVDARRWLGRVLEMDIPAQHAAARARVACLAAQLALLQADIGTARHLVDEAGDLQPNLVRFVRLSTALATGDGAAAAALLEADADVHEPDRHLVAALQIVRARIALELEHLQEALQLATRAGTDARTRNDHFWLARAMHAEALVALRRRQLPVAQWLVEQSLSFQLDSKDMVGLVDTLCAQGHAELSLGASSAALQAFSRAFDTASQGGLRLGQLHAAEGLACASASVEPDAAQRLFATVDALRHDSGAMLWHRERRQAALLLRRGTGSSAETDPPVHVGMRAVDDARWAELTDMAYELATPIPNAPADAGDLLTPREREVAGLLARGLSNRQIAGRMAISIGTVRSHVEHILMKLGLHSRAQVALWALHERRPLH
jgi:predicted ATPase/DNA-binding CsgD family transcriptional regulator